MQHLYEGNAKLQEKLVVALGKLAVACYNEVIQFEYNKRPCQIILILQAYEYFVTKEISFNKVKVYECSTIFVRLVSQLQNKKIIEEVNAAQHLVDRNLKYLFISKLSAPLTN